MFTICSFRGYGATFPLPGSTVLAMIRAQQIENRWQEVAFDAIISQEPFLFYFKKGLNTIRLTSRREPMAIAWLKLYQEETAPDYETVAASYQRNGYQPTQGQMIKIQGEEAILRSDSNLIPISEQGDPTSEPYHPVQVRLNAIGGHRWSRPGQWMVWEFEVPEDGLYKIAIKGKQDRKAGAYSNPADFDRRKTAFCRTVGRSLCLLSKL